MFGLAWVIAFLMIAGLLVAAYPPQPKKVEKAARRVRAFRQSPLPEVARSANLSVQQALSPNERFQTVLHPFTSYVVVPVVRVILVNRSSTYLLKMT